MSELVATDREPGAVFAASADAARKPRHGDELECEVVSLDGRGTPFGSIGAYRVEFEGRATGALPGARVCATVISRKRACVRARVTSVTRPSPDAIAPRCAHVRDCGGCRFQDLAYARQLVELEGAARARLSGLALHGLTIEGVVAAADPWRYRNKMDFTFASRRWREADDDGRHLNFALGLHASGRHDKALDVRSCHLQDEVGDRILCAARELAMKFELPPWDLVGHTGFLRHLVVRRGQTTGEWLVYVVTSTDAEPRFEDWWRGLLAAVPQITTIVHGPTARASSVALGDVDHVLFGPGFVRERLGGHEFRVSARSFFQTNTLQAERLLDVVRDFALGGRERGGVLWDLYCGAGVFAIALSSSFERTFGVELVAEAVLDARANAQRNGVSNAEFEVAPVEEALARAAAGDGTWPCPDVAIVDPPRAGLHRSAVDALAAVGPPRLVYVACHLESAARDLALLLEGGASATRYRLLRTTLVDLFPHTPHIEGVFLLERLP